MREREFRDRNFRILGRTRERSDGRTEAYSPTGRVLGSYDPETDETRDPTGTILGHGNFVGSFFDEDIFDEEEEHLLDEDTGDPDDFDE